MTPVSSKFQSTSLLSNYLLLRTKRDLNYDLMSKMALDIKEGIPLAPLTTFHIGGNAKFFVETNNVKDLTEAVKFAKNNSLAIFVLGGGSNILISDGGFDGLVIKMNIRGIKHEHTCAGTRISAGAGEMWDNVVAYAVELRTGGIENLSLIPGTVGGAVYQNIGAYGTEVKDVLTSVQVYDVKTGDVIELSNKKCGFTYRSSVFKKNKNFIIIEAEILLSKSPVPNLSHFDLQKKFNNQNPTIDDVRQAVIEIRLSKIPYPPNIIPQILKNKGHLLNAGSFFKNPIIADSDYQVLLSRYLDLRGKEVRGDLVKLSAAQLIEKAGWKGKRIGNVGVADKHALVLVNYGSGTARELAELERIITKDVKEKFGVELEAEVEKVG